MLPVKKERRKSIIIALDPEFRRRMPSMLIEVGFPAEKFTVKSATECKEKIKWDKEIFNLVIHGADFPGKEVFELIADLDGVFTVRQGISILVFLDEDQYLAVAPLRKKFAKIHFAELPARRKDLNKVFNPIGGGNALTNVAKQNSEKKPSSAADTPKKGTKNLNFYETSDHVKDTIDSLGKLKNDRGNLEALFHIGQRFNGIFGAFAFVKDKPGYAELAQLAHIIDDIARHYQRDDQNEITEKHYTLMLEAAKCSYLLLKQLRDTLPVDKQQLDVYAEIKKDYDAASEIQRRESLDQAGVDSLLAEAFGDDEDDQAS